MGTIMGLPRGAKVLAAQFEDNVRAFNNGDRRAGERAWRLLGDLIDALVEFRGEWRRVLDERRERGNGHD